MLLVVAGTLRAEANTGSPVRQTDPRLANITGPSSERSGVPIGSELHTMQSLASFEPPKFGSEGRPAREGASRKGARPCPSARRGWCATLTYPYDTYCIRPRVQGAWAVRSGAMGYVDELRVYGVLGSSARKFQISLIWGMRLVPHACYLGCVDQLKAGLMSPVLREGNCVL
jgi:hypothetical protein